MKLFDNLNNFHTTLCSDLASNNSKQTFVTNKENIFSYVNIGLC